MTQKWKSLQDYCFLPFRFWRSLYTYWIGGDFAGCFGKILAAIPSFVPLSNLQYSRWLLLCSCLLLGGSASFARGLTSEWHDCSDFFSYYSLSIVFGVVNPIFVTNKSPKELKERLVLNCPNSPSCKSDFPNQALFKRSSIKMPERTLI